MTLKFITVFFIFSAATISYGAHATVSKDDLAACASHNDAGKRLVCYDDLAKAGGLLATESPATNAGSKWTTNVRTDPLTDESIYTSRLSAEQGSGRYGDAISLLVRCEDNTTEMYINWNSYLGRDSVRTTYRVGKEKALTSGWTASTDGKAAFFPSSPIPTLKKIIASEDPSFVASVTPYSESPVTAIFNTTGAEEALADIRKGCNW